MGQVTRVMAVMMEIAYWHGQDGRVRVRRDWNSFRIQMEQCGYDRPEKWARTVQSMENKNNLVLTTRTF
jgi:hypothetical protein